MNSNDQVMQFFGREYNEVLELYNDDDKEEECVAAAQDLLENPDLPRYHRIITLIPLSAASGDWDKAEDCRLEAERLWDQAHSHYTHVDNPDASRALAKLRVDLDDVKEIQREELDKMFRDYDDEDQVDDEEEVDEEEDDEEDVKEERHMADVEIDVDVDTEVGVDAAAAAFSDDVPAAENEESLDGMEGNTPDVAPYEHAKDKGEPLVSNGAEDATDTKSDEGTEDKKASATVRMIRINDITLGHQLTFTDSTPKQIDGELALQSWQERWFGPSSQPRRSSQPRCKRPTVTSRCSEELWTMFVPRLYSTARD